MKKEISIPLTKVEDLAATNLRRENYALKRDQQNTEVNAAIAARLDAGIKKKCEKCGKEFVTKAGSESVAFCPECR